jgi:hypothetical protein
MRLPILLLLLFASIAAESVADGMKTCIDYTYPINSKPDSCCLNNTIYDTANSKCAYCHPGTVYDNGINRCKADTRLPQSISQSVRKTKIGNYATKNECKAPDK